MYVRGEGGMGVGGDWKFGKKLLNRGYIIIGSLSMWVFAHPIGMEYTKRQCFRMLGLDTRAMGRFLDAVLA